MTLLLKNLSPAWVIDWEGTRVALTVSCPACKPSPMQGQGRHRLRLPLEQFEHAGEDFETFSLHPTIRGSNFAGGCTFEGTISNGQVTYW
jgi:hypothetical protein